MNELNGDRGDDVQQLTPRSRLAEEVSRRIREGRECAAEGGRSTSIRPSWHRRSWRPLLGPELTERARSSLAEIAVALRQPDVEPRADVDRALFFAYLAEVEPDSGWDSISKGYLDSAVAQLAEAPPRANLHDDGGFIGVAWTVEHLEGGSVEPVNDPNQWIDELLRRFLTANTPWPGEYDLIGGLAGLGVYGLERAQRPIGRECLSLIVDRLAEEAEARDGGVTWLSKPQLMDSETLAHNPSGHYNLGVAHGVPAVALVLAGACRAQVNAARARPLLEGAVDWMLSNRLDATSSPSAFPYCVRPDGTGKEPARSAWCYGDPGVAAALLAASKAVCNRRWESEALALMQHVSARPMNECGVRDAGLCHGAAGLALLYSRMWQTTDDELIRGAATRWYERTLDLCRAEGGAAGYRFKLLRGVAGIGLSLLAGISSVEPAWDRLLAASVPPFQE